MKNGAGLILTLSILALFSLGIALGCVKPSVTPDTDNVPESAVLLGRIKLKALLQDPDIEAIANKFFEASEEPQTLDEALNAFALEMGIDLRDFTEVLFFGDPSRQEADGDYFGVILKGDIEKSRLLDSIAREGDPLTSVSYKGREIHVAEDGETAVTFLDDDLPVIGSRTMIQDVIDVTKGEKRAISGRVLDTFNSLGDVLISIALEVPPQALEELSQETPDFGINIAFIQDIEVVVLSLDKRGENITAEATLDFAREEASAEAAEGIEGLLSFIKLFINTGSLKLNEEVAQIIDSIEVKALRTEATLSLDITVGEILNLIEALEGFQR